MLKVERDDCGIDTYIVYNDYGDVVLYTTDGQLARIVAYCIPGVRRDHRLTIGGDVRRSEKYIKVFHHIRNYQF
jgi:hypothetical protein